VKICQTHWDQMRAEVARLGIDHIGAKSGEEAMSAAVDQLERAQVGGSAVPTNAEWDPLMAMNWSFFNRALEVAGLAAMNEDFGCPLCHARADYDLHAKPGGCGDPTCARPQDTSGDPTDESWIRGCAEAMRQEAISRGLVRPS
jgi:hypothetical protein